MIAAKWQNPLISVENVRKNTYFSTRQTLSSFLVGFLQRRKLRWATSRSKDYCVGLVLGSLTRRHSAWLTEATHQNREQTEKGEERKSLLPGRDYKPQGYDLNVTSSSSLSQKALAFII
jgi:hypothetical protein